MLSVAWFVCCLPVVTIGVSTAAACEVAREMQEDRDNGIFKGFWRAIKRRFGTGMLLPTLLTWAVNQLTFPQRGRGTGLWTGTLFIGQFVSPIVLAILAAGIGGLQPALAVLGGVAALMAVVTLFVLRDQRQPLNVTAD